MYAICVLVSFANRGGESLVLSKVINFPWVPSKGDNIYTNLCTEALKVVSVEFYTINGTMAIILEQITCSTTGNYDKILSNVISNGWEIVPEIEPSIMSATKQ